jgi:hypothetical protein
LFFIYGLLNVLFSVKIEKVMLWEAEQCLQKSEAEATQNRFT